MLGGGADGADLPVEGELGWLERSAGQCLVRDGGDAVDAGVADVGESVVPGDQVLKAGGRIGVRVVAGAVDRVRADRGGRATMIPAITQLLP